ncbi:MAG: methyltransferase domain-containing protein [candidate division Zixibacteria bacterium]|nr:methyltransferase domain-containing protein [candidate division Zixibacteria bacterium]
MDFYELLNISEKYMDSSTPSNPEKLITAGEILGLKEGERIIDLGCGYAQTLILWAEHFGINGVGIEIREEACKRARNRIEEKGLNDKIEIANMDAREFISGYGHYDVAVGMGVSYVWNGYRHTIRALRKAIHKSGRLFVGEPIWLTDQLPKDYTDKGPFYTSFELLKIARSEGFDYEYMSQSNFDELDRFESDNWRGILNWIRNNPGHCERNNIIKHFHKIQDEYLRYGRQYMGWLLHILAPVSYSEDLPEKSLKLLSPSSK